MSNLASQHHQSFDGIRQDGADGRVMVHKAIKACENSEIPSPDHFSQVGKMVWLGSGTERQILDYHLSCYACYLIAPNSKPVPRHVNRRK